MRLALTMVCRNEEANLQELVPIIRPFVDEIVIGVDASSTDDTMRVAIELCRDIPGAAIMFPHEEFACEAHNRVQALVNSEWTLMLDADERPGEGLMEWIAKNLPLAVDWAQITRENRVDGLPIGRKYLEWHTRLFRSHMRYISQKHQFVDIGGAEGIKVPRGLRIIHDKSEERDRRSVARVASYNREDWGGRKHLRLNVGSGNIRLAEDIINIDAMDLPNVDMVWDFTPKMKWNEHIYPYPGHVPFEDGVAAEVFCYHVLEHISYHHASDFIAELARLLEPGGRIEIATPDLESIIAGYIDRSASYLETIQELYAGQDFLYNFHNNCVDMSWLRGQLLYHGFEDVKRLPSRKAELRVEARKKE